MEIKALYDEATFTLTYIVYDSATHDAVVIDSVMDYDAPSSKLSFDSVEKVMSFVSENNLKVHYILDTHAHADHMTGSHELKKRIPEAKVVIGREVTLVQATFKKIFNLSDDFSVDGRQFDVLIGDGEEVTAGSLTIQAIHVPGHTQSCYAYRIGDAVFTGDILFMPDYGVARCDFPNGSAETLFDSVTQKLYTLPDETRMFTGHDYLPGGRELRYESTIGESKEKNIHVNMSTNKEDFVKFRNERDKTLAAPKLLLPSLQININAGVLPQPESNDVSYLKIPVRVSK